MPITKTVALIGKDTWTHFCKPNRVSVVAGLFVSHRVLSSVFFPQFVSMRKVFAILLSVSFLFVTTALTQNISAHLHHDGHDQQTHEQTWCSWSCQAGQGIDILTVFVENLSQILTILDLSYPTLSVFDFTHVPTSRGPPFLLS